MNAEHVAHAKNEAKRLALDEIKSLRSELDSLEKSLNGEDNDAFIHTDVMGVPLPIRGLMDHAPRLQNYLVAFKQTQNLEAMVKERQAELAEQA